MALLPATMTAIAIARPGGPEVLVPEERPLPRPGPGQVLVRVLAAGVNRPDVMQRRGLYPPPPGAPDIPGLEIAGEVVALGAGAERWKVGDGVTALVPGGGYAEYAVVHWTNALPIPPGLDATSAAAMPETFFTVWHNVFERGGLEAGETLLVHGGSSGIGTVAVMLGVAFGATVYATAGSADKCAACAKLGAARAINYREEDYVAVVKEATGGRGADVILDMVGGDYVARNYDVAAEDGRIVQIAFLGGSKAEVDLNPLMRKRLTHTGSTLRNRPVEVKAGIARGLEQRVWPLLAAGHCRPVIDSVFPLRDAAAAHARIDSGAHVGKIMLEVAPAAA
ncbi:MAG TPA: NAD(P)H-quinone oxidoreductase [Hyphomicrobiales bacterium]|nr:NAD(P)H-quinone oxidoreductase [Hyphomicrobiales bacterium]